MYIIVTGAAGFIGFHLCKRLLLENFNVIGIDNLNSYYDLKLKKSRLRELEELKINERTNFKFFNVSIENKKAIDNLFADYKPEIVINLAAQAGVRHSIEHPEDYVNSNLVGFANILECCKYIRVKHLIYASSSSVYGGNTKIPFSENDNVNHPISLYAATKRSNELMAHTYSHLFDLATTGLRFFTVYGPWGRPDMALFTFTKNIIEKKPIKIFNNGDMIRDFTYIDDVIESIMRVLKKYPKRNPNFDNKFYNPSESWAPFKILNIGNSNPTNLMKYINLIEENLGQKAIKEFLPMQPGDVKKTFADTSTLENWIDFKPNTDINFGVKSFLQWFKKYYEIN